MVARPENTSPLRSDADRSTLGSVVRERRRALRLSQQDLADLADVGVRLVHEVEHDSDSIQLRNLVRLLRALGLRLELARGAADTVGTSLIHPPGPA